MPEVRTNISFSSSLCGVRLLYSCGQVDILQPEYCSLSHTATWWLPLALAHANDSPDDGLNVNCQNVCVLIEAERRRMASHRLGKPMKQNEAPIGTHLQQLRPVEERPTRTSNSDEWVMFLVTHVPNRQINVMVTVPIRYKSGSCACTSTTFEY